MLGFDFMAVPLPDASTRRTLFRTFNLVRRVLTRRDDGPTRGRVLSQRTEPVKQTFRHFAEHESSHAPSFGLVPAVGAAIDPELLVWTPRPMIAECRQTRFSNMPRRSVYA